MTLRLAGFGAADDGYAEAFNRAVDQANRLNMDVGVLRNRVMGGYDVFLLPQPKNRSGHELRAEVVRPGTPKMELRGLGGAGDAHNVLRLERDRWGVMRALAKDWRVFNQFRGEARIGGSVTAANYDAFLRAASAHGYALEVVDSPVRGGFGALGRAGPPPRRPRGGGWLPERPAGPPPIDWARVTALVHKRWPAYSFLRADDIKSVAQFADWENQAGEYRFRFDDKGDARNPALDDPTEELLHYIRKVNVRSDLVAYFGKPDRGV